MSSIDLEKLGQRPIITTVAGEGSALGRFDRVQFNVTIRGSGKTSVEAKQGIKEPLANLQSLLKESENEGVEFAKDKTVSPYNISREMRWDDEHDRQVFSHYAATYSLRFIVMGTESVTVMMDKLTEIDGLEVASPTFMMGTDQQRALAKEALKFAVEDAKANFAQQCELIGKNPDDFEVWQWSQNRFGGTGLQGAAGGTGPVGALDSVKNYASRIVVSSGEARVTANISLGFTPTAKSMMSMAKDILEQLQSLL